MVRFGADQSVLQALVRTFAVVMHDEILDCGPQGLFSEQDQAIQTGLLDAADKPFCMGIQIRRSRWQFHGFDTHRGQQAQKLGRVQRIAVMDQVALLLENAVDCIRHCSANLGHPQTVSAGGNARDLDPACGQIQKEQDEEALQPSFGPYFHTEEIGCYDQFPVLREKRLPGGLALALGAGSMPCRRRMSAIVRRAIVCPRCSKAPWIRR
jgi:hypothetical protein